MAKLSIDEIIAAVEELNTLELVTLYKTMQDKWGVTPMAAAVAAAPTAAAAPAEEVEEKTTFDVIDPAVD